MKVLLTTLNAKYIHSNLALRYLYAAAFHACGGLTLMEFTINHDDDSIYLELMAGEYEAICFSCYIWNIERTLYLAKTIRKARPKTLILLGGPEAAHRAEELLRDHGAIDMILAGEGEESFPKLLRILEKAANVLEGTAAGAIREQERQEGASDPGRNPGEIRDQIYESCEFETIEGLIYRKDGQIRGNPKGQPLEAAKIPFPYGQGAIDRNQILYYEASRGCPYACSYCLSSLERGVRPLPLSRVREELLFFLRQKVKQVKFVDRTFNWHRQRAMELFRFLMEEDNGVTNFHMELCGDLIDDAALDLLSRARPGLFQFEIGVQSTNPSTLSAINRTSDFDRLSSNLRRLRKGDNIHLHLDLIAGLPYEDYSAFRSSFNQVCGLSPHHLQLGFLKLLPGTPIREQIPQHGYVYRERAPYEVIANRYLSAEDLVRLKRIESVLDRYYNRGGFQASLNYATESMGMTAFDFYEEFSDFYYRNGFQKRAHNKENLYRILYQYGLWKDRQLPGAGEELGSRILADVRESHDPEAAKRIVKEGWNLSYERE